MNCTYNILIKWKKKYTKNTHHIYTYPLFAGRKLRITVIVHSNAFVTKWWWDRRRWRSSWPPWWARATTRPGRYWRSSAPGTCYTDWIFTKLVVFRFIWILLKNIHKNTWYTKANKSCLYCLQIKNIITLQF